jgi:hypothetical protein
VTDPLEPRPASEPERERQREAQDRGEPFLTYRDRHGGLIVLSLPASWDRVTIGRSSAAHIPLAWDLQVSTVHAQLERIGGEWVLVDDGLSRNGSYVNGERIPGRRRLDDEDELRFGRTRMLFHAPFHALRDATVVPGAAGA